MLSAMRKRKQDFDECKKQIEELESKLKSHKTALKSTKDKIAQLPACKIIVAHEIEQATMLPIDLCELIAHYKETHDKRNAKIRLSDLFPTTEVDTLFTVCWCQGIHEGKDPVPKWQDGKNCRIEAKVDSFVLHRAARKITVTSRGTLIAKVGRKTIEQNNGGKILYAFCTMLTDGIHYRRCNKEFIRDLFLNQD